MNIIKKRNDVNMIATLSLWLYETNLKHQDQVDQNYHTTLHIVMSSGLDKTICTNTQLIDLFLSKKYNTKKSFTF